MESGYERSLYRKNAAYKDAGEEKTENKRSDSDAHATQINALTGRAIVASRVFRKHFEIGILSEMYSFSCV